MADVHFEEAKQPPGVRSHAPSSRSKRGRLRVDPQEIVRRERNYLEQAKEDPRGLWISVVTSTAAHILLVLLMFGIYLLLSTVRRPTSAEASLELGFLTPQQVEARNRPKQAVRINAFNFDPNAKRPEPEPEPSAIDKPDAPDGPPVRPVDVRQLLTGRTPRTRISIMRAHGDEEKTERAIEQGLRWLERQQQAGGNWRLHEGYPDPCYPRMATDAGATALALLCYLGAGHTHQAGEYQDVVKKGLDWLTGQQAANGDFHDYRFEYGRNSAFYAHSQATIVVCEAMILTGDESLREPVERAVRYLVDSQNPSAGGWKYHALTDQQRGDLSVTGWALMALHTARAAGIEVPGRAFELASTFLDSVSERDGALYKYEPHFAAVKVTPAMTAEGLLCRQFLGWPRDHPAMLEGMQYLARDEHKPEWSLDKPNVYYWYYAAHVHHNLGGQNWLDWYDHVRGVVLETQVPYRRPSKNRDVGGSWNPKSKSGDEYGYAGLGGRLYLTSMCLLILETPARHRPIYAAE